MPHNQFLSTWSFYFSTNHCWLQTDLFAHISNGLTNFNVPNMHFTSIFLRIFCEVAFELGLKVRSISFANLKHLKMSFQNFHIDAKNMSFVNYFVSFQFLLMLTCLCLFIIFFSFNKIVRQFDIFVLFTSHLI